VIPWGELALLISGQALKPLLKYSTENQSESGQIHFGNRCGILGHLKQQVSSANSLS
jgi:hypothetical protein